MNAIKYLTPLLVVACGAPSEEIDYEYSVDEVSDHEQPYSTPTPVFSLVRMLGTTPAANGSAGNLACRNGQSSSTDCRFVSQAPDDVGFYVFINVGVDEQSWISQHEGTGDVNDNLTAVIAELNSDQSGGAWTDQRYWFTKTTYANSHIALRRTPIGSVLTTTTTDVFKFMNVSFHGCSSALTEEVSYPGTWKRCTSGIVNLDTPDYGYLPPIQGYLYADIRKYIIASGILSAMGLGLQGVRNNQKNYVSLTTASVGQSNYWGPANYSENPTRCVADWACWGPKQWSGSGANGAPCEALTTVKFNTSGAACSGID